MWTVTSAGQCLRASLSLRGISCVVFPRFRRSIPEIRAWYSWDLCAVFSGLCAWHFRVFVLL